MAYIEAHQSLLTHRKTLRLVRLLGIDKYGVGGRLVALWHWAIDNAPDGDLGADCADILAEVMGWDGEPERLMDALTQVGYVDRAENGAYLLHDWWDYAGRLIEKRKSDLLRFGREYRELRQRVIARDGLICGLCGQPVAADDVDIDHIIPRSLGGPTTLDNLRVTHSHCNRSRGNCA